MVHPHPNAKIEQEVEFFAQTALAEARTHSHTVFADSQTASATSTSTVTPTPTLRKQTWHMTHQGEWLRVENEVLAYENTTPPSKQITQDTDIKQDIHESGRWRGTSHSQQECFLPRDLEAQGVA